MFLLFLNEKTVFPAEGQMFGAVLKFIGIEEGDDELIEYERLAVPNAWKINEPTAFGVLNENNRFDWS